MKKKILVLITIFLLATVLTFPVVYAAGENGSERADFFKSMFNSMRSWINETKENGDVTEEEAYAWEEHFNYMERFHEENGYGPCGGLGGRQSGRGMMGGYYNGGMMERFNNNRF